jgi:exosortase/archaeosortase family protein
MVAYFLPYRWWVRSLFIVSTIPVAVVTNAFRVGGTGVLAHHYGIKAAEGFFHTFSGWLVFVCAFVILIAEVALIRKLDWGRIEEKGTIA